MYSQSLESTSSHEGGKGLSPYTMDQTTTYYTLGIDIGSTTVKVALLDQDLHIIFSDYERHYANIQETREFDTSKLKRILQSLETGLFFCQIFVFII